MFGLDDFKNSSNRYLNAKAFTPAKVYFLDI